MPRKKEGLGAAFSCRLFEDQDKALREEARRVGIPLATLLRILLIDVSIQKAVQQRLGNFMSGRHGVTADTVAKAVVNG